MFLITLQSIPNVKILIMKIDSDKGKKKKKNIWSKRYILAMCRLYKNKDPLFIDAEIYKVGYFGNTYPLLIRGPPLWRNTTGQTVKWTMVPFFSWNLYKSFWIGVLGSANSRDIWGSCTHISHSCSIQTWIYTLSFSPELRVWSLLFKKSDSSRKKT